MDRTPQGPRILLADEDRLLLGLLAHRLGAAGFEVDSRSDAGDVLEVLHRRSIQAVIVSLTLPGRTGVELLHQLRARSETRDLPILALAMPGDDRIVVDAFEAGADDVIERPVVPVTLIARLRKRLRPVALHQLTPEFAAQAA